MTFLETLRKATIPATGVRKKLIKKALNKAILLFDAANTTPKIKMRYAVAKFRRVCVVIKNKTSITVPKILKCWIIK